MDASRTVQELLRELKGVRSPLQKMKLLALAWRKVRELSPSDRRQIAAQVGIKEAEVLLERLGRRKGGIPPAELLGAIETAKQADPSQLRQLIRDIQDPSKRKELVSKGLGKVQEHLRSQTTAEEQPSPEKATERIPEFEGTRGVEIAEPVAPGSAEPVAPDPAEAPPPPEAPPRVDLSPEPPPASPSVRDLSAGEPSPVRTPADSASPAASEVLEKLGAAPSLMARFRIVRQFLAEGDGADADQLRSILGAFPHGWARRRVLMALFRERLPPDLEQALSLIEDLQNASDRRWCTAALLDSRDLSPQQMRLLHERLPFPSLRRRLRWSADHALPED